MTQPVQNPQPFQVPHLPRWRGRHHGLRALADVWRPLIRKLISLKIGQPIRTAEEVHKLHELHGKKAGTPTMGGILILGAIVISTLLWAKWDNVMVWIVLFTTIGLGALGFRDDYLKISKKNSKGVSARTKLVWQTTVAVIAG
jgi:phospho-N-acetylmuramoyl-pentapeptide-transferase